MTSPSDRSAPDGAGDVEVRAVLFDLDDTLFDQRAFLDGAFDDVADAAGRAGADRAAVRAALAAVAAEGSDRGHVIDRALERAGAAGLEVAPLVAVFLRHRPARLEPYAGVARALERLRSRVPVGLVTDGDPAVQQAKLAALGLVASFDAVVSCDELGRAHRKPDPAGLVAAARALSADPASTAMVGDRPDKDGAAAAAAGMVAIRVRTGEYRAAPDHPATWASVPDAAAAVELLAGCRLGDGRRRAERVGAR